MTDHSGKLAALIAVAILFYFISPPLVYKAAQMIGMPMSQKAFMTLYAPLVPLVENVKPYSSLIQAEAEFLHLE